jgi:hypothetical protein
MGNEQRYFYDYHMLCCGPLPLAERMEKPHQAISVFGADGALLAVAQTEAARRDGGGAELAAAAGGSEPLP